MLISTDLGEAVAYAMWNLEDRGPMMIEPGWKVYRGMIVGEHTRGNDLEVNVLKGKKLTNIRTHSKDEAVRLTPPIRMTLEKAMAYIEDDELVEVTPKSIRLRKKLLDPNERKKEVTRRSAGRSGRSAKRLTAQALQHTRATPSPRVWGEGGMRGSRHERPTRSGPLLARTPPTPPNPSPTRGEGRNARRCFAATSVIDSSH